MEILVLPKRAELTRAWVNHKGHHGHEGKTRFAFVSFVSFVLKKTADRLFTVGGDIYEACSNCDCQ